MARPSGTVTFLFTDVEGSTAAWDAHHAMMSKVQARHDEIVRTAIQREDGYIFSTGGDGVAAAFQSARSAVSAAVAMQRAFASELWPPPLQVRVRMGMNTGEAIERNGDYFGPAVIKAARLMSLVGGGRIICSAFTAGMVKVHLTDGLELLPVGTVPLKGLSEGESAFVLAGPGLIEQGTALEGAAERAPPRHNLPLLPTPLIDSDDRLGSVRQLVLSHRLVTLSGAGGVGKTRLAVELGWSCLEQFDAGAWLVELVPVTNADTVVAAVLSTLSIRQQQGFTPIESLVDWFHGRELLLILDNCEHVLDAVHQLVGVLLARCPTVKVVATSREPLGLAGEHVYSVNVLSPEIDGVALFLDRAVSADSSFSSSDAERHSVVDICRRLDGLPLAIELAAARVRSIAPVDLLARLDDRFKLLRSGTGKGMGRHDALRTTVEWSYQLLNEPARVVFARLSVFAGGFDVGAAEVVCAGGTIDDGDVLDLLSSLVDKSMVMIERHPDGTRYKVLETLRRFGEEQLPNADVSEVRQRHLHHYVGVAEAADTLFRSARQVIGAAIFEREWDNLRTAHEWAVTTDDLAQAERLINASFRHALSVQRLEHGTWVEQAIALGSPGNLPSPDTFAKGALWAYTIEDVARANELILRATDLALSTGGSGAVMIWALLDPGEHVDVPDPFARLEKAAAQLDLDREWWVLIELADKAWQRGSEARSAHVAKLVETAGRVRAPTLMAAAALEQGHHLISQRPSEFADALALYTTALDTARQCGDLLNEAEALRAIALATVGLHPDKAIDGCRNALIKLHEIRYWYRIWHVFESIGLALASLGEIEAAATVVGNLEAHHPPFGYETTLGFRDRTLEIVRRHAQVEEWMARGAAMDRYEIVEHAYAALEACQVAETTRHWQDVDVAVDALELPPR